MGNCSDRDHAHNEESYAVQFRAYRTQIFWTVTMMYSIPPIVCAFAYKGLHDIYNSIYTYDIFLW